MLKDGYMDKADFIRTLKDMGGFKPGEKTLLVNFYTMVANCGEDMRSPKNMIQDHEQLIKKFINIELPKNMNFLTLALAPNDESASQISNRFSVAKALYEAGCDPTVKCGKELDDALKMAVKLVTEVAPNKPDQFILIPKSAYKIYPNVSKFISELAEVSDINEPNFNGDTAAHIVSDKLLKTINGEIHVHSADYIKGLEGIYDNLVKAGANIDHKNKLKITPKQNIIDFRKVAYVQKNLPNARNQKTLLFDWANDETHEVHNSIKIYGFSKRIENLKAVLKTIEISPNEKLKSELDKNYEGLRFWQNQNLKDQVGKFEDYREHFYAYYYRAISGINESLVRHGINGDVRIAVVDELHQAFDHLCTLFPGKVSSASVYIASLSNIEENKDFNLLLRDIKRELRDIKIPDNLSKDTEISDNINKLSIDFRNFSSLIISLSDMNQSLKKQPKNIKYLFHDTSRDASYFKDEIGSFYQSCLGMVSHSYDDLKKSFESVNKSEIFRADNNLESEQVEIMAKSFQKLDGLMSKLDKFLKPDYRSVAKGV